MMKSRAIISIILAIIILLTMNSTNATPGVCIEVVDAKIVPHIDGINSTNEWDDCKFYTYTWTENEQNITSGDLILHIGLKYNETHLFTLVSVNDNDYNPWDFVALIFDANNNVSMVENDHLALFASNSTYDMGTGFGVSEDGTLWSYYCAPRHSFDEPVNVVFGEDGYTFEAAFNLTRLNLSKPQRLNIIYIDADSSSQASIANPLKVREYPPIVFEDQQEIRTPPHPVWSDSTLMLAMSVTVLVSVGILVAVFRRIGRNG